MSCLDQRNADSGAVGVAWAGRQDDTRGLQAEQRIDGDLVVAVHEDIGAKLEGMIPRRMVRTDTLALESGVKVQEHPP